ncbi:MAG: tRNA uridine-5-carboxymethylaminomethyl(34) synthesis GTPase MnmE, partial [Bacilli bacterium]|nr:tRNA uridine-5-carboxymethylaminomethyl(34) synthesis GTPase MnmE [Bacilli bacterium]
MEDTICAVATSLGVGAISIVRVTGKDAIRIVNPLFKGKDLEKVDSHTVHYGHIVVDGENIDEVLLVLMRGPKTYTTEDTIEINCHGGINTTNRIMEVLLQNGCRLAEPGEFTKRALLNGRISLLEAESVNDLIVAKTDASRKLALNNVDGMLTKKIRNLREKLAKIISNIEVNIDYPEYEDEVQVTNELIEQFLGEITKELNELVSGAKNGRMIKEGINIAIIGRPNVGKSSILNFLLDEEKAIVTDIPGTTRDVVEGAITLNGVQLNFIDTAGIRETDDVVEQIGVDKSKQMANSADLVLFVFNNNDCILEEELQLLHQLEKENVLVFINKSDLEEKIEKNKLSDYSVIVGNTIDVNGLDGLLQEISKRFLLEQIVSKDMSYISNLRQADLIHKASEAISHANESHRSKMSVDLIEIDLKLAWDYLGELIGDAYADELVDTI